MDREPPRTAGRRKADTIAKLTAVGADVWVATASSEGGAARGHLVPVSLAWIDDRVVIAVLPSSRTARSLPSAAVARLGLGPTRDVVMIDAVVEAVVDLTDVPGGPADRYAEQSGWDPRLQDDAYVLIVLRPERIQAWREEDELAGRTLMRGGSWLI